MGRSKDIATSAKGDADYVNVSGDTMTGALTVDTSTTTNLTVDSANYGGIQFKAAGTNTGYITSFTGATESMYIGGADKVNIHTGTNHDLTGGTTRLQIDASGHVTMPNQVGFFARRTSHVTSQGDIAFDTAVFNRGSHYNTSNGRFTAPVDGVYLFTFSCLLYSMNGPSSAQLRVNGSAYGGNAAFGTYGQFTGSYAGQGASAVAELNANDYVTIFFYHSTTNLHSNYTWWSGFHLA